MYDIFTYGNYDTNPFSAGSALYFGLPAAYYQCVGTYFNLYCGSHTNSSFYYDRIPAVHSLGVGRGSGYRRGINRPAVL